MTDKDKPVKQLANMAIKAALILLLGLIIRVHPEFIFNSILQWFFFLLLCLVSKFYYDQKAVPWENKWQTLSAMGVVFAVNSIYFHFGLLGLTL
jgi:hypothetical protein